MITLPAALNAWGSPDFSEVVKKELAALGPDGLSLVQHATVSGYFSDDISIMILNIQESEDAIAIKIGVLYTEIEPAYCCPMIPMEHSGMCEMNVTIDKNTARMSLSSIDT